MPKPMARPLSMGVNSLPAFDQNAPGTAEQQMVS